MGWWSKDRTEHSSASSRDLTSGRDMTREVRRDSETGETSRWSESAGRWVDLGTTDSLSEAEARAESDISNIYHK